MLPQTVEARKQHSSEREQVTTALAWKGSLEEEKAKGQFLLLWYELLFSRLMQSQVSKPCYGFGGEWCRAAVIGYDLELSAAKNCTQSI